MTDEAPKHPGGRPSEYFKIGPDFVNQTVLKLAGQGASVAEWAAELGVSRPTIDYWNEHIPEFSEAFTRAKALEQAWWEKTGRDALYADKFNSAVWSKTMSGRFRNDYAERREVTGENGGPVENVTRIELVSPFDDDDAEDQASA